MTNCGPGRNLSPNRCDRKTTEQERQFFESSGRKNWFGVTKRLFFAQRRSQIFVTDVFPRHKFRGSRLSAQTHFPPGCDGTRHRTQRGGPGAGRGAGGERGRAGGGCGQRRAASGLRVLRSGAAVGRPGRELAGGQTSERAGGPARQSATHDSGLHKTTH